ncbi:hypothetical protein ACFFJX_13520 [Pseudarcicella hirudinis]|uniref:hypothetical protein n=1 Tax=Pseudarcicella hirudinis TaxID=1079859 RepID=UPI0035E79B0B
MLFLYNGGFFLSAFVRINLLADWQNRKKRFNAILSALHLLLTIWIMIMLALPIFNTLKHPLLFFECLAILLLAQVLFLINIIITLIRK